MVNGFMYSITTCTCIWCNSKKKENNPSNQHKQQARKATPHDHCIATTCNTVKNKIFESPVTDNNISAARNNGCTICLGGTSQKVPTLDAILVVAFWFSHQSFYLIIHVLEYELLTYKLYITIKSISLLNQSISITLLDSSTWFCQ